MQTPSLYTPYNPGHPFTRNPKPYMQKPSLYGTTKVNMKKHVVVVVVRIYPDRIQNQGPFGARSCVLEENALLPSSSPCFVRSLVFLVLAHVSMSSREETRSLATRLYPPRPSSSTPPEERRGPVCVVVVSSAWTATTGHIPAVAQCQRQHQCQ